MAAKLNTTKRISLQNGSMGPQGSGKTVPGPGAARGGGQTAKQTSGGGKGNTAGVGVGFGNARGLQKGKGC